ncbi:MAG: response regulator [Deltaproteobacteria bacterium]|nr:response regulator [Deltaproteobacteria bacterium]
MNHEDHNEFAETISLSILVVEDNLVNQRLIMAALTRIGHKVDSAADGQIAVDKFKENTYDAILMDIMMPNMDGVTACKLIRELEQERNIPESDRIKIIAVTANPLEDDRDRFLEAGMDMMMNKPIDIKELQKMLYE